MQNSGEIRWFWPNPSHAEIESWFRTSPFHPGGGKPRSDVYLMDPGQLELGIKRRGGTDGVEVKGLIGRFAESFQIGSLRAQGELWTKWNSPALKIDHMPSHTTFKTRWLRKFEVTDQFVREVELGENEKPLHSEEKLPDQGCNLEFTTVSAELNGQMWSTLGFESFGPYTLVESILLRTLAHLAAKSLPTFEAGKELSYPAWLASQHPTIS